LKIGKSEKIATRSKQIADIRMVTESKERDPAGGGRKTGKGGIPLGRVDLIRHYVQNLLGGKGASKTGEEEFMK